MYDFYDLTKRISFLHSLLQDDLSRDIFWTRVQFDVCPTVKGYSRLANFSGLVSPENFEVQTDCIKTINSLLKSNRKLLLYGAGARGGLIAKCLRNDGIDFTGFCDRSYDKFQEGPLGKPVFSPTYLLEHQDEYYIIITSCAFRDEIVQFLTEHGFPTEHILPYFSLPFMGHEEPGTDQYFEFPQLFPKGTAFVDCGCFDGQDSIRFAKWSNGEYSKIIAFEPDPSNYKQCRMNLKDLPRTEVIHAGIGDRSTSAAFLSYGQTHSKLVDTKRERHVVDETLLGAVAETIQLTALDDLANDQKIGFIKMDIEGAEWQALHGAEKTIVRDKPLLAICVYHIPGDTLAIMDYLSSLVPEYRFWLRHYVCSSSETVLYAAVEAD